MRSAKTIGSGRIENNSKQTVTHVEAGSVGRLIRLCMNVARNHPEWRAVGIVQKLEKPGGSSVFVQRLERSTKEQECMRVTIGVSYQYDQDPRYGWADIDMGDRAEVLIVVHGPSGSRGFLCDGKTMTPTCICSARCARECGCPDVSWDSD